MKETFVYFQNTFKIRAFHCRHPVLCNPARPRQTVDRKHDGDFAMDVNKFSAALCNDVTVTGP